MDNAHDPWDWFMEPVGTGSWSPWGLVSSPWGLVSSPWDWYLARGTGTGAWTLVLEPGHWYWSLDTGTGAWTLLQGSMRSVLTM